jgi:3-methyladenine DNA glycosylase AlkC
MKDGLDERAVRRLAAAVGAAWSGFDRPGFLKEAASGLSGLELKERLRHIIRKMHAHLPEDYPRALKIVVRAGRRFPAGRPDDPLAGFAAWPLVDWVGEYGRDHFDPSMKALRDLTKLFSAEFAIRPFLIDDSDRALDHLHGWCNDPDERVRRLISEGTRPRLPWGRRLPGFSADPGPVLRLLDNLKDDPAEFVRRSVANNLNDIAKDHPATVVKVCRVWKKGATKDRRWIIRHGLRTLVKQGDPGALKVLGYTTAPRVEARLRLSPRSLKIGGVLELEVTLTSQARRTQKLVVDYVVHHRRARGDTIPKVFKLRTFDLEPAQTVHLHKKHSFVPRTVRRYYPGKHAVELMVGGRSLDRTSFSLTE